MTIRRPDFPHISRTTTDQGSLSRPAAVPQPSPRNPPTANAEQAPKAPVALALADGLTRDLIRLRFERLGWQVLTVDDGRNALHLLQTRSLALILLDLWLPQINGLDVLRQARRSTPAIILSDVASPELVLGAAAVGALGFVLKPIDLDALVARARQAMASMLEGELLDEPGLAAPISGTPPT